MFTSLTTAETGVLRSKLYSAGHQFATVSHALGREALALPPLSSESDVLWARRSRYASAMTEAYDLAESIEAAR